MTKEEKRAISTLLRRYERWRSQEILSLKKSVKRICDKGIIDSCTLCQLYSHKCSNCLAYPCAVIASAVIDFNRGIIPIKRFKIKLDGRIKFWRDVFFYEVV